LINSVKINKKKKSKLKIKKPNKKKIKTKLSKMKSNFKKIKRIKNPKAKKMFQSHYVGTKKI
jgi:hypothetical protein